jgi:prolyl-tRNA synthetase
MLDYYSVSGCYILKPWSYSIWEEIQRTFRSLFRPCTSIYGYPEWFNAQIKELDVQNSYFPMFVSSKVLEREKDHIEGFSPEVAWVTKALVKKTPFSSRVTTEIVCVSAGVLISKNRSLSAQHLKLQCTPVCIAYSICYVHRSNILL